MTAAELFDWWIYYQEEPWGDERADLRQLAAIGVANGVDSLKLPWPYVEIEPDPIELVDEYRQLKEAFE